MKNRVSMEFRGVHCSKTLKKKKTGVHPFGLFVSILPEEQGQHGLLSVFLFLSEHQEPSRGSNQTDISKTHDSCL